MPYLLDGILIVCILLFLAIGIHRGFAKSLVGLIGTIAAVVLAVGLSGVVAQWVYSSFFQPSLMQSLQEAVGTANSQAAARDVLADMDGRLPLILDGGDCQVGVESTVVSIVGEKPVLLRPGYITLEQLEAALGEDVTVSGAILEKLQEGEVARSPGMKYKHYAPRANITILDGSFAQYKAYVEAHRAQQPACLCFTGEDAQLDFPCVCYGREGDGSDQARHLFRCLRALDEQGDRTVYARCPEKDGVSMAVYNRLIRAAAFRVVQL